MEGHMKTGRVLRLFVASLTGALLAGCAITPGYVEATVTTDGMMRKSALGQQFAWILTEEQRQDPLTHAIIGEVSDHLEPAGLIETSNPDDAELLIALRTGTHFEEDQVVIYTVQRYVPGPSRTFEREVEVYDSNGTYLGTRREVVRERAPGRRIQEQRERIRDGYERLLELSFISAEDFRENEAEPFYTIRAVSEGHSDSIGPVGRCMVQVIFHVFPGDAARPFTGSVTEEYVNYCNLEGF